MVIRKGPSKKGQCCKPSKCYDYSCCSHIDCNKILCEFHKLVKESEKCFESAEEIQEEVLCNLLQSLLDLEESMECYYKGKSLSIKGEKLLDCSPCCFECNRDSCECRCLKREAIRAYSSYEKDMLDVICMLKKLIVTLKHTSNSACDATKIYNKYFECVHCSRDKCGHK